MEEIFVNCVLDENKKFLTDLIRRSDNTRFDFEFDGEICRIGNAGSCTGIDLLKIFAKMVQSTSFKDEKVHKLYIKEKEGEIKVTPNPSNRQPGNAWIEPFGPYTDYEDNFGIDVIHLSRYFARFLRSPLSKMYAEDFNWWKLSILLVFEIARRIPEGDVHRDLPIAAIIAIALEYKEAWFCDAFRNNMEGHLLLTERKQVCNKILMRFYREFEKATTSRIKGRATKCVVDEEAKDRLKDLMKIYDDPEVAPEESESELVAENPVSETPSSSTKSPRDEDTVRLGEEDSENEKRPWTENEAASEDSETKPITQNPFSETSSTSSKRPHEEDTVRSGEGENGNVKQPRKENETANAAASPE